MPLIPLKTWAASTYGDNAPGLDTLRRWARDGKITPTPQKHGRQYFVPATAVYNPGHSPLVERLRNEEPQTHGLAA